MKLNQKAVKVLEKLLEANYVKERVVSSITVDQMLALRGVSVSDIAMINDLQKRIKEREVLSLACPASPTHFHFYIPQPDSQTPGAAIQGR